MYNAKTDTFDPVTIERIEATEAWLKTAPDEVYANFFAVNGQKLEKKNGKWTSTRQGTKSLQGYTIIPDKVTRISVREATLEYLAMADCWDKWTKKGWLK